MKRRVRAPTFFWVSPKLVPDNHYTRRELTRVSFEPAFSSASDSPAEWYPPIEAEAGSRLAVIELLAERIRAEPTRQNHLRLGYALAELGKRGAVEFNSAATDDLVRALLEG